MNKQKQFRLYAKYFRLFGIFQLWHWALVGFFGQHRHMYFVSNCGAFLSTFVWNLHWFVSPVHIIPSWYTCKRHSREIPGSVSSERSFSQYNTWIWYLYRVSWFKYHISTRSILHRDLRTPNILSVHFRMFSWWWKCLRYLHIPLYAVHSRM